ncbi:response regulator [Paenibacillus chartarius]|uniref:Response regulator n=1 Tax=Paenibacillus chartarius TaxID=747481 RepID=A0ABV6DSS7_9BACL
MPKLLIVDDETIFRKGVRHLIAEMNSDWTVVDEARDGLEAIEKVEFHRPDFIITDVRMPRMDGIQLQHMLKERYPFIRCIVMSGFSDFEYARQSLKLGAKDYLMKPLEREELYRTLWRLKEEWLADKGKQLAASRGLEEDRQTREQLRQHILTGLVQGTVKQEELELLDHVGLSFPHPCFVCCVAQLDRESVGEERYARSAPSLFGLYLRHFMQETIEEEMHSFVFVLSDTKVVALLNYEPEPDSMQRIVTLAVNTQNRIRAFSSMTVTIGVGNAANGLDSIARSCKEAETALYTRLITGGDRVYTYENPSLHVLAKQEHDAEDGKLIERILREGHTEHIGQYAAGWIHRLCDSASGPDMIRQQICKLLLHVYELVVKQGAAQDSIQGKEVKDILSEACSISSRTELISYVQQLLIAASETLQEQQKPSVSGPIEAVLRYIDEHYAQPITLGKAAEQVYLSPPYLSSLFKARTGKSFIDYVTERRIEEAKKRLAYTDEKIVSIADSTGFANIRHFNRVFKTFTQLTPKQYREQAQSC